MPDYTSSGVQYPLVTDQPLRQSLEDMAKSIDIPRGVDYLGKIRNLETTGSQTFPSGTGFTRVNNWVPAGAAREGTDQGDACGIVLTGGNTLTVTESGIYYMYANYPWSTSGGGIRRVGLVNVDTGEYINTRSISAQTTSGFLGADTSYIGWVDGGTPIGVEAAQSSGSSQAGGNITSRTCWIVAKLRVM